MTTTQPNLNTAKVVPSKAIDVTQYIGKKVKIATVEVVETKYGWAVKMTTETVGEQNGVELTGSVLASLDKEGNIVEGSKLHEIMTKYKAENPQQLQGKEVILQTRDKDGKSYLTF